MTESQSQFREVDPSVRLDAAETRFASALARLEGGLSGAVHQVAELARRTGWEDGHAEGRREGHAEGYQEGLAAARTAAPAADISHDETLRLREALAASREREKVLAAALAEAQAAIDSAIDDIKAVVGPL